MLNDYDVAARVKSGDKSVLNDVYKEYSPMIGGVVRQYEQTGLSPEALNLEAKRIVAKSLKTYDPGKGPITSHLQNSLKSMFRETNKASQMYIPDTRALMYRKYKDAYTNMSQKYGRPPKDTEMADVLKIGIKDIRKLSKETGVNIVGDKEWDDIATSSLDQPEDLMEAIRKRLGGQDVQIFDMSMNGNTNAAIGKKLGVTEGAIRQRKDNIIKLIREME